MQTRLHFGPVAKEREGFAGGEVEHLGDILATISDFEGLRTVSRSLTLRACSRTSGKNCMSIVRNPFP